MCIRDRFQESDRLLEEARASVSVDDHARLARVELTLAEALLLQANVRFSESIKGNDDRSRVLASAQNDYTRAGDALQRARELLTRGSRDVERWSCYYRLWAQYQAESCLFYLAELGRRSRESEPREREGIEKKAPRATAALLRRIRRGLSGVQAGIVIKRGGHENRWLQRTWLELLSAGMWYGVKMTTVAEASNVIRPFWDHWVLMNERAGIPETVPESGPYAGWLNGTRLGEWFDEDSMRGDCLPAEDAERVSPLRDQALRTVESILKS